MLSGAAAIMTCRGGCRRGRQAIVEINKVSNAGVALTWPAHHADTEAMISASAILPGNIAIIIAMIDIKGVLLMLFVSVEQDLNQRARKRDLGRTR